MQRKWELDDGLDGREEFPLPDGIGKSLRGSAEEAPTTSWIGDAAVSAQPPVARLGAASPLLWWNVTRK